MGSGYGYRSGIDLTEVHSAILAKITGRPIKTMYTREEDFVTRTRDRGGLGRCTRARR